MNNKALTLEFLAAMIPGATLRELTGATQVHWMDGQRENSITMFRTDAGAYFARKMSSGMNDVQWHGDVRFSSTI